MAADALAPCVARSSTAMALNMQYKRVFVFHKRSILTRCAISWLRNDRKRKQLCLLK